jgi:hypothetical protein
MMTLMPLGWLLRVFFYHDNNSCTHFIRRQFFNFAPPSAYHFVSFKGSYSFSLVACNFFLSCVNFRVKFVDKEILLKIILFVFYLLKKKNSLVESCDLNILIKKIEAETYVKQTHRWKKHHFFERLSCFGNTSAKSKISEQSRLLDTKSCDNLIDNSDNKGDIEKN